MPASDTDHEAGAPPPDVTLDAPPQSDSVTLDNGSTSSVRATHVEATQAALGRVLARDVHADQGAIGFARADRVEVSEGAVGAIYADQVETRDGFVLLMIAKRVTGDVTVLLDWRAAAAFAGVLVVLGRLLRVRR
jgi:hypothetical protein